MYFREKMLSVQTICHIWNNIWRIILIQDLCLTILSKCTVHLLRFRIKTNLENMVSWQWGYKIMLPKIEAWQRLLSMNSVLMKIIVQHISYILAESFRIVRDFRKNIFACFVRPSRLLVWKFFSYFREGCGIMLGEH